MGDTSLSGRDQEAGVSRWQALKHQARKMDAAFGTYKWTGDDLRCPWNKMIFRGIRLVTPGVNVIRDHNARP